MKQYTHARRVGLTAIAAALLLRLWSMGLPERLLNWLQSADGTAFLIYAETGRNVRFSPSSEAFSPDFVESPPASAPAETLPEKPTFSESEVPEITYAANKNPDMTALLTQPLEWELYADAPTVLILHTHSTESYTQKGEDYVESSSWRTLSEEYNMLSIGAEVAAMLNQAGISTIQDRQLHDYPSYNGSYVDARKSIQAVLEEYPTIQLVLDLHRDASGGEGGQLRTLAQVNGEDSAQLMVVLGTNYKTYEENLSLGLKLHVQLQRQNPGIMRPLQLRSQRFNQDLCPGALLIEVGAAGNSHKEAMIAAGQLAKAIIALGKGSG